MIFSCRSRLNRVGNAVFLLVAVGLACAMSAATAHRAEAVAVFDSGQAQYGWTTPFSTPNDASYFVKTQGRCTDHHSGLMYFRDGNQQVLFGPVQVPGEWHFADGYGFQLPAGLTPGDYDVYVDCGDWNQIIVAQWITGPGTLAQLLDYRDTAAPASSGPAVTVPPPAPAPAPSPSSGDDSGVYVTEDGSQRSTGTARSRPTHTTAQDVPVATDQTAAVAPPSDPTVPSLDAAVTRDVPTTGAPKPLVALNTISRGHGGGTSTGALAGAAAVVAVSVVSAVRRRRAAINA